VTVLLALTGRAAGIRYTLEDETTIGRASDCTIQLLDDAVSRRHAVIRADDGFTIEDLDSANGTVVDGAPLEGKKRLAPGDLIGIGATTFAFEPSLDYVRGEGADVIVDDGAATRHDQVVAVDGSETSDRADRTAAVLLGRLASALSEGEDLLGFGLKSIAEHFSAERAFVLVGSGAARAVKASYGPGPITVSRTVVERVFEERCAIASANAAEDRRFEGGVSLAAGGVRALLAAPLVASGSVVGLVHLGASRPFADDALDALVPLANVLALVCLAQDGLGEAARRAKSRHRVEAPAVIAESAAMKRVLDQARRAASAEATVLITGPTGAGKEVVARTVHTSSPRADGPFVAVNCGALVDTLEESELFGHLEGAFTGASRDKVGLFEAANGGTLFLDEIGDTTRATQVKLLRALQEKVVFRVGASRPTPVDVRIVAATSRRLEEAVAGGDFREDLFFRLSVVRLDVPPLASRPEDVVPLARAFVARFCRAGGVADKRLDSEVETLLASHTWPGNVRELENLVERLVILADGDVIRPEDLPLELWTAGDVAAAATARADTLAEAVQRLERAMILRAMARTGAVKTAVADALQISRVTLDKKIERLGIPWPK
jgi:DNA-binding NtrC family response regulator